VTTVVRTRLFRAVLSCGTCRIAVAVGPACEYEPLAAYELGRADHASSAGVLHLGVCGGGALQVTVEEVANDPPPPRGLTSV
jgi:ferredoxin